MSTILQEAESACQRIMDSETNSEDVKNDIAFLATASRDSPEVRDRLANVDLQRKLTKYISSESADPTLRCLGNACTTEAGREAMAKLNLSWVTRHINQANNELLVKVMWNLIPNCKTAAENASDDMIHYYFPDMIRGAKYEHVENVNEYRSMLLDILYAIVSTKDGEYERLSDNMMNSFLELPGAVIDLPEEDYAVALDIILIYIKDPRHQEEMVGSDHLPRLWKVYTDLVDKRGNSELLAPFATSLLWHLSDISATQRFATYTTLKDEFIKKLLNVISEARVVDVERLHVACQVVGNLLVKTSPKTTGYLVTDQRLHAPLMEAMVESSDAEFLHSAGGLLNQLARAQEAKDIMGEDPNAEAALTKLCTNANTQLKQDGLRLLKTMGYLCAANRTRFKSLAEQVQS
ncbi:hypothetical protein K470DRAFT_273185 [Piedraia hortae CBS 480.64]|uniref:ARM repeat-containing protein n=1 Tax=Piedraia hortae CBS 480.64 TaxID=1314780 RepID=A0A6A7BR39_9PEZI|nr:hypothetical protein K470DRAFT_273185 [Piedraia hortae CBS 480.64]